MNLQQRVKNILLQPQREWAAIHAESTTEAEIWRGYVMPLAAIGPVASWIGMTVFGMSLPLGVAGRTSPVSGLARAIVSYAMGLAGVWVLARIVDTLAPRFGGQRNPGQALKVVAYSATAAWVAGIFGLIPALSVLGLLGLYSLYLLYLGLPVLMKAPAEKALPYTIVVIIIGIVVAMVVGAVARAVGGA